MEEKIKYTLALLGCILWFLVFIWAATEVMCKDWRKKKLYISFLVISVITVCWIVSGPLIDQQHRLEYWEKRDKEAGVEEKK